MVFLFRSRLCYVQQEMTQREMIRLSADITRSPVFYEPVVR